MLGIDFASAAADRNQQTFDIDSCRIQKNVAHLSMDGLAASLRAFGRPEPRLAQRRDKQRRTGVFNAMLDALTAASQNAHLVQMFDFAAAYIWTARANVWPIRSQKALDRLV